MRIRGNSPHILPVVSFSPEILWEVNATLSFEEASLMRGFPQVFPFYPASYREQARIFVQDRNFSFDPDMFMRQASKNDI
jgi:hypothetical protein